MDWLSKPTDVGGYGSVSPDVSSLDLGVRRPVGVLLYTEHHCPDHFARCAALMWLSTSFLSGKRLRLLMTATCRPIYQVSNTATSEVQACGHTPFNPVPYVQDIPVPRACRHCRNALTSRFDIQLHLIGMASRRCANRVLGLAKRST